MQNTMAAPSLVIDVDSGTVISSEDASQLWYPASVTKLMTVYVALKAVRDHQLTMDTPFLVSARASRMAPSKMGFKPGTLITLDNALKILMVKSANDVSVTVAEGISGSVESFADQMNANAAQLGMRDSHFVNPNGLPNPNHYSSARDLAILARALLVEFPEHADLFGIGALQLGSRVMTNHNSLLGRYEGVDGMKTGFTCAAGFNVVTSATRGGRRIVAVVLGSSSVRERSAKATALMDNAFANNGGGSTNVVNLPSGQGGMPPDMHRQACGKHPREGIFSSEGEDVSQPLPSVAAELERHPEREGFFINAGLMNRPVTSGLSPARQAFAPVPIYVGPAPGWQGEVRGPVGMVAKAKTVAGSHAQAYAPNGAKASPFTGEGQKSLSLGDALPLNRKTQKKPAAARAKTVVLTMEKPAKALKVAPKPVSKTKKSITLEVPVAKPVNAKPTPLPPEAPGSEPD